MKTFADFVKTDPLYMHEYGHTRDSHRFGPIYIFYPGLASLWSAAEDEWTHMHDFRPYERSANRRARKYFGKYYGVTWSDPDYPLYP